MRSIGLLILATLGLLIGYLLGINSYIHSILSLNLLFIIPIGGTLFGGAIGFCGALIYRILNIKLRATDVFVVGILSILSFLFSDFSAYQNLKIDYEGNRVAVHKAVSFEKYMSVKLGKSSQTIGKSKTKVEVSASTNRLLYYSQLFAAFLLGMCTIGASIAEFHYCDHCKKYLKAKDQHIAYFDSSESLKAFYGRIINLVETENLENILELKKGQSITLEDAIFKNHVEHRTCNECGTSIYYSRFYHIKNNDWVEMSDLKIEKKIYSKFSKDAA